MELDYKDNKGFRLLQLYERLSRGEVVRKAELAQKFAVTDKTIQRDIEELRAYLADERKEFPTIFRIDRIARFEPTGVTFRVIHGRKKFSNGAFRKRIQFMYAGELRRVTFDYSGTSVEAVLNRLPTAKIISEENGVYRIAAEVYGNGIDMWLRSQGSAVKVVEK